jgi:transcriptional regulator with XRE-family HTH domain
MTNEATDLSTAERLAIARRRAGLSQSEVAERAGCTPAAISMIEHGKRNPSLDMAHRIADVLDVSLDWLAYGRRGGK